MKPQRYSIAVAGRHYGLVVTDEGLSRRLVFSIDGDEVVHRKSADERVTLTAARTDGDAEQGELLVRLTALGRVRRATLHLDDLAVDLDPEPGSPGALREERARRHPRLYAARHLIEGLGSVAWLLVGGLVVAFVLRVVRPLIPDVDAPSLPLPDLPSLPWPDWSLPEWSLPGWIGEVVRVAKYVIPVLVGLALAVNEVRRRRQQEALKRELGARTLADRHESAQADPKEGG